MHQRVQLNYISAYVQTLLGYQQVWLGHKHNKRLRQYKTHARRSLTMAGFRTSRRSETTEFGPTLTYCFRQNTGTAY